jgi:hypothetical protein
MAKVAALMHKSEKVFEKAKTRDKVSSTKRENNNDPNEIEHKRAKIVDNNSSSNSSSVSLSANKDNKDIELDDIKKAADRELDMLLFSNSNYGAVNDNDSTDGANRNEYEVDGNKMISSRGTGSISRAGLIDAGNVFRQKLEEKRKARENALERSKKDDYVPLDAIDWMSRSI